MTSALTTTRPRSWKDYLMGTGLRADVQAQGVDNFYGEEDLELSEVDIVKSTVNGIPSINFSERVNQILIKDMAQTVGIKLLGRNIGYPVMYNKVCSLWKPSQSFRLMDLENGYFLAKFQSLEDFEKPYPSLVMAWIRLPGLLGHMYKRQTLWEIGGMVGKVVLVNGVIQRVEYEYLTTMCFSCGHYGHIKELCPNKIDKQKAIEAGVANGKDDQTNNITAGSDETTNNASNYGPWMLVERKGRRSMRLLRRNGDEPERRATLLRSSGLGVEKLKGTTMMELLQRSKNAEKQEDEERNTKGLIGTPPGSTFQPDLRPRSKGLQAVLGIPMEGILEQ
ncbi:hypothetical protein Goarm_001015 [Gossypium armourianum]|uniref:CCHC-type domain-containing protein n=1 Tax=Gossypium armourianum TaxID=34283 RepID=A0A7J9KBR6_9ROSI|nr:hypothetical protein [Gossypium armourianum]